MDITNKTWRSGGVDIRSGGDNSSDAGQDPAAGSGGSYQTQGSVSSGTTSGGFTWTSTGGGLGSLGTIPNTNQAVQQLLAALGQMGTQSLSGFTNKKTNLFSMQFIGFDGFGVVSASGYENREVLDEQAVAMASITRSKAGWSSIDIMIMDDDASDVLNILNHQFNVQISNAETFDMILEHYDDQGNQTATTYLYGCTIDEFASDPLNAASSNKSDMKVILTITPRTVTFA